MSKKSDSVFFVNCRYSFYGYFKLYGFI